MLVCAIDVCPSQSRTVGVLRRERDIVFNCFFCGKAGKEEILRALGLRMQDLFVGPRPPILKAIVSTTYPYTNINGVLLAEKVRMTNKDFWWRRPDPHATSGWRNDRKGVRVGVYRIHNLIDRRTIFLTEGEKACDRLWLLGLPACCGPDGAGTWKPEWSQALYDVGGREFVILADHDRAGVHHAELVAGITAALEVENAITVRVVHFPDLADKADAFDYLASGHDADDLLALVDQTPIWTPDDRKPRQRRLRAARNRKLRTRQRLARETLREPGREAETQRRLERTLKPRRSEAETVDHLSQNTLPRSQLAGRDACERSLSTLHVSLLLSEILPSWVTDIDESLSSEESDWPFALRDDEDAEQIEQTA